MATTRSLWSLLCWVCMVTALVTHADAQKIAHGCTGGVVYIIAHPVDSLLFQNPDLLQDLYVLKCVTTVVLTSGDRGVGGNVSLSLERGLQKAYTHMAGMPIVEPDRDERMMAIGTHHVQSWSLRGMANIQIIYLRLPDGSPSGQGHDRHGGQSLTKLYNKEIDRVTTTDGQATYTLRDLKELVALILHMKKPNDIKTLNHKLAKPDGRQHAEYPDHADHVVSAKLVHGLVIGEKIQATVQAYAGNNVRRMEPNIESTLRDCARKASAFFEYATYDEKMCQTPEECASGDQDGNSGVSATDDDVRYATQYLRREYYVV